MVEPPPEELTDDELAALRAELRHDESLIDSQIVYEATRMIRQGAAAFVQTVSDGGPYYLYGPGFQVEITRTDPAAPYPGQVEDIGS